MRCRGGGGDPRSSLGRLETIRGFKARRISFWLLDLGDVSGNGVSELIMMVLAAVAQFERTLISEWVKDTKRNLRRAGDTRAASASLATSSAPTMAGGRGC